MPQVHINGKWLGQPQTGVQRYAGELSRRVVQAADIDWVLHVPRGASAPEWATASGVTVRRAPVAGQLFEQLYLPVVTWRELLLNFGGVAPLVKRRQAVTFFDATPFRFSSTYRKAFVVYYFVALFLLSRTVRRVATISDFSRSELADVLRIDPSRITVVPCASSAIASAEPVEPDLPGIGDDAYLVVGTFARHKNLLEPVRAIAASGRTVVVVGAAADDKVYARAETGFGDGVIVAPRLSDPELAWLYRRAKALVFPSLYEGFGLPVLEAQIVGCPVIASDAASIPEVGGDAALYFDPHSVENLLAVVENFENTPGLREELISRGFKNVFRYSWDESADSVVGWVRGGEW